MAHALGGTCPTPVVTCQTLWGETLPLNPARCIATSQPLHFLDTHTVEVTGDAVFERAGGDGELQRLHGRAPISEAVDQPGGKGIAGTDSIAAWNKAYPCAGSRSPSIAALHLRPENSR